MEKYKAVLEAVIQKEVATTINIAIALALIVGIVWFCHCFHVNKMKKKQPSKYRSEKQMKIRRKSLWASIGITSIAVCLAALTIFFEAETISNANLDMEENAYITYTGDYYVRSEYRPRKFLYDRWMSVTFEDGDYVLLYIDNFSEWLTTEEGRFHGTVVYGENSRIVVSFES